MTELLSGVYLSHDAYNALIAERDALYSEGEMLRYEVAAIAEIKAERDALAARLAKLEKQEPTGFSLTKISTSTVPRTVESIFEAMDKEVAAGRVVRTGPMEWRKIK